MKNVLLILIGAIGLALVGCGKNSNNPKAKESCTIRYFLNDSLLHYVDVSIVDSLHLEEGALPYSIAPLDTTTSEFWISTMSKMYGFDKELRTRIPVSAIKVLTLSRNLPEGTYQFCLHLTRNELETGATIPVLSAREASTTIKKWSCPIYLFTDKELKHSDLMSHIKNVQQSSQVFVSL